MKKLGFFIFGIIIGFILLLTNNVLAANCGGAVQCNCGDTLNESQTMWYDLKNCSGNGIRIGTNNITLDCNGYLIDGNNMGYSSGIYSNYKNGTSIENCNVREFYFGIYFYQSSGNILTNIMASDNRGYGIFFWSSSNNTLTGITANSNYFYGIYLLSSSDNRIINSIANSNDFGIYLESGSNNNLSNITANSNSLDGISLFPRSSSNNTLTGITANSNWNGISLFSSSNNTLTEITANSNKYHGIYLSFSSNNTLTGITANNNTYYGIYLDSSSNNILSNNTANNNSRDGIILWSSSKNNILTNITANYNKWNGIHLLYSSNNNQFTSITANSNFNGIYLDSSSNNILTNITANYNYRNGIYLASSSNNTLLSNMFCSNNKFAGNYYDIYNTNSNSGDENTCDTTYNWNDTGTTGCTYACSLPSVSTTLALNQNWNLISIPLTLQNNSIESVFGSIMDKVIVINSFESGVGGGAKTYDPLLPEFSDLHNIDSLHGYWVKMNESANLSVNGTIPINKTINLDENWNLISYLCNFTKNVTDVFSSIMNKVIVINGFDNGALTYDPLLPEFSDLQEMKPKYGYWIKMNQSALLDYEGVC